MFIIQLVISLLFHAEAKTVEDHTITNLHESHKHVSVFRFSYPRVSR